MNEIRKCEVFSLGRIIKHIALLCIIIPVYLKNSMFLLAAPDGIQAPSCILMEASTGQIIYENNADERRSPASITKIITLLLVFEELEKGQLKPDDEVITSAYVKSMGGSQVFLEEGEIQTVETLIKCVAVASGNDASVALAEKIAGSEMEFVAKMNLKAKELSLENTNFEDCSGLSDSDSHYTTARDVAIISRELITRYPQVFNYTKIWMEDIVQNTNKGSETFTLSSTNKLLKQYPYATGLKTGSTSKAKYCLSATANHNGIDLIAVVMGAPDYKVRFQDARTLLDYGYSVSQVYHDKNEEALDKIKIEDSIQQNVQVEYEKEFRYLDINGNSLENIEKKLVLPESVSAPVKKGAAAGNADYYLNGQKIGSVAIVYSEDIKRAEYKDYFLLVFQSMLL